MEPVAMERLLSGVIWDVDAQAHRVAIRLGGHFSSRSTVCFRIREFGSRSVDTWRHWNVEVMGRRGFVTNAVVGETASHGMDAKGNTLMPVWVNQRLPSREVAIEITCTRLDEGDWIDVQLFENSMNNEPMGRFKLNAVDPTMRGSISPTYVISEEPETPWG